MNEHSEWLACALSLERGAMEYAATADMQDARGVEKLSTLTEDNNASEKMHLPDPPVNTPQPQPQPTATQSKTSLPDQDNAYYHPHMTLGSAANRIARTFKQALDVTSHQYDDQIVHPSITKPYVIGQLQDMVREMRWAAQFLSLGRLGWELVDLPHQFFDDVKAQVAKLNMHLQKLRRRQGLQFLGKGMEELERVQRALRMLQGWRKEIEVLSRIRSEADREAERIAKGVTDEGMRLINESVEDEPVTCKPDSDMHECEGVSEQPGGV